MPVDSINIIEKISKKISEKQPKKAILGCKYLFNFVFKITYFLQKWSYDHMKETTQGFHLIQICYLKNIKTWVSRRKGLYSENCKISQSAWNCFFIRKNYSLICQKLEKLQILLIWKKLKGWNFGTQIELVACIVSYNIIKNLSQFLCAKISTPGGN